MSYQPGSWPAPDGALGAPVNWTGARADARGRTLRHSGSAVPLAALIARRDSMVEVMSSGRVSDTPDEPVYLKAREDMPGFWEIADGHHRVAAAIAAGLTHIAADLDPDGDEEPYEPPFYDFGRSSH